MPQWRWEWDSGEANRFRMDKLKSILGNEVVENPAAALRLDIARKGYYIPPEWDQTPLHNINIIKAFTKHANMPLTRGRSVSFDEKMIDYVYGEQSIDLYVTISKIAICSAKPVNMYLAVYDPVEDRCISEEWMIQDAATASDQKHTCKIFQIPLSRFERYALLARLYIYSSLPSRNTVRKKSRHVATEEVGVKLFRPFGCALIPLEDLLTPLKSGLKMTRAQDIWLPLNDKNFADLPKHILNESFDMCRSSIDERIMFNLQTSNEDFSNVADIKLFNRHIMSVDPSERLHQIFLTIHQGVFKRGRKRSDKSVQVKVQLCDEHGSPVDNCIKRGISGIENIVSDSYETCVIQHCQNPKFEETVTISLTGNISLSQCHIYIEFSHCSSKDKLVSPEPFAFAFLPISNSVTDQRLPDQTYRLDCFKYKYKSASPNSLFADGKGFKNYHTNFGDYENRGPLEPTKKSNRFYTFSRARKKSKTSVFNVIEEDETKDFSEALISPQPEPDGKMTFWGMYILVPNGDTLTVSTKIISNVSTTDPTFSKLFSWNNMEGPDLEIILSELDDILYQEVSVDRIEFLLWYFNRILYSFIGMMRAHLNDEDWMSIRYRAFKLLCRFLYLISIHGESFGVSLVSRFKSKHGLRDIHAILLQNTCDVLEKDLHNIIGVSLLSILDSIIETAVRSQVQSNDDPDVSFFPHMERLFGVFKKIIQISSPVRKHRRRRSILESKMFSSVNIVERFFRNVKSILYALLPLIKDEEKIFELLDGFVSSIPFFSSVLVQEKLALLSRLCNHSLMKLQDFSTLACNMIWKQIETHIGGTYEEKLLSLVLLYNLFNFAVRENFILDFPVSRLLLKCSNTMYEYFVREDLMMEGLRASLSITDENLAATEAPEYEKLLADRNLAKKFLCCLIHLIDVTPSELIFDNEVLDQSERPFTPTRAEKNASANYMQFSIEDMLFILNLSCNKSILDSRERFVVLRAKEIATSLRILSFCSESKVLLTEEASPSLWRRIWALTYTVMTLDCISTPKVGIVLIKLLEGDPRLTALNLARDFLDRCPEEDIYIYCGDFFFLKTMLDQLPQEINDFILTTRVRMLIAEVRQTEQHQVVEGYFISNMDSFMNDHLLKEPASIVLNDIKRLYDLSDEVIRGLSADQTQRYTNVLTEFIEDIREHADQLYAISLVGEDKEDIVVEATLSLIEKMENRERKDLSELYLLRLVEIQIALDNYVEMGMALLEYAGRIDWYSSEMMPAIRDMPRENSFDRKMRVLREALGAFRRANDFEKCVKIYREMSWAEETLVGDYVKSSAYLIAQSSVLERAATSHRAYNQYYSVSFFGSCFSERDFVYKSGRGLHLESVREFTERVRHQYPDADIVNGGERQPENIRHPDFAGQLIQIKAVTPYHETQPIGVNAAIRDYWNYNDVDRFMFTRRIKDRQEVKLSFENEFSHLWVEQVILRTEYQLPSYSRRVRVVETEESVVSPLDNAVRSIVAKTQDLRKVIDKCQMGNFGDMGPLSMTLQGVIDAAVQGGIPKYREAFFQSDYLDYYPQDRGLTVAFDVALEDQISALGRGLQMFAAHCSHQLQPLCTHLQVMYDEMRTNPPAGDSDKQ